MRREKLEIVRDILRTKPDSYFDDQLRALLLGAVMWRRRYQAYDGFVELDKLSPANEIVDTLQRYLFARERSLSENTIVSAQAIRMTQITFVKGADIHIRHSFRFEDDVEVLYRMSR